ncbi:hypothetical protein GUITHDRAFT_160318 [Guillardia theta CCMP2712]|uniref:FAD dependent oxidoreductase domain-containing protein n=1 Tax=Guillardia theta (strain CCMP2712) TaxID=905079 RepID=L1I9F5_GUITC|nr:hypothetical protein GUITHDRAFT_160318 [Guillardia theta CCMP2712]EKX32732.1 hypothetical protein GUITHDRAFT_160318 [Guillardia theta CCMP2712]|eukprot:XP_005819712.1 hypothetical protein GUITHDRAFT_160318 [Guillardia theta CCMP2712]
MCFKVVICGAGVVGSSVAYFLSKRGVPAAIVDRAGVAPAASGKAGGFLAKDWNDGTPIGPLASLSFSLHEELAQTLGLDSYRRLSCHQVAVSGPSGSEPKRVDGVEWVDIGVQGHAVMGTEKTIAQVHPKQLTEALMKSALDHGCSFHVGVVQEIKTELRGDSKHVAGVIVDSQFVPCEKVVIAMGPWSSQCTQGLKLPPMLGQKYHSVLMQNERELSQAIFFHGLGDPEVYPRPKGEVYVTGFPDTPVAVEDLPGQEVVRPDVVNRLTETMKLVSTELGRAEVTRYQACYLPISVDGLPLIGKLEEVEGVYIATGHGCWGILNGPATGLVMSELIVDGVAKSVDISPFDPNRFKVFDDMHRVGSSADSC